MSQQIQLRHDTAANWASVNPILASGETGWEVDTSKVKLGDGVTAWSALAYVAGGVGSSVPTPETFNAAVRLDGNATFGTVTVSGPVTLSVDSTHIPVDGGQCKITFTPDGVNTPVIPAGWLPYPGSQAYSQGNKNNLYVEYSGTYSVGTIFYGWLTGAAVGTLPGQVTGLTLGAVDSTSQALTWSAPSTGGAPTDYEVQYSPAGANTWATFTHAVSTATGVTVTGLTSSFAYDYQVRAKNSTGSGVFSTKVTNSTQAPGVVIPGQVTGLAHGTPDLNSMPLSWTAPSTGGASTDYIVQFSPAGANTWTTFADGVSTATSTTVTGLTAGTAYDFRVAGTDSAGPGTYSTPVTATTAAASATTDTFTAADGTAITGRVTETGSKTYVVWSLGGTPLTVLGNKAFLSGPYHTAGNVVPTSQLDGVFKVDTTNYGGLIVQSDNNGTELTCWINNGVAQVDRRFRATNVNIFTGSVAVTLPATLEVDMTGGSGTWSAIQCVLKVNGAVVYTGTPYSADAFNPSVGTFAGIFQQGESGTLDNFSCPL